MSTHRTAFCAGDEGGTPLDELDRRILIELQEDGRRSYREIGKRVGVAPGTVRSRVLQLIADHTVEVVGVPNLFKMGFQFYALLGLRLDPGCADEVASILVPREEITWVGLAATGYDVLVEVALRDAQEFGRYRQDVLSRLPGFQAADVYIYWDVRKLHYRVGAQEAGIDPPANARPRSRAAAPTPRAARRVKR